MILYKKNFRDFRASLKLFSMCILLTALGIVGYCGMSVTYNTLEKNKNEFYSETSMADLFCFVRSMPEESLEGLEEIKGIRRADGVLTLFARLYDNPDHEMVNVKIISYDRKKTTRLNDIVSSRKNHIEGENILIGKKFWDANAFIRGKKTELYISEDRKLNVKVIGSALSPDYLYALRDAREYITDDKRFTVAYLDKDEIEDQLGMGGVCNQIGIILEDGYSFEDVEQSLRDYLEEYGLMQITEKKDQTSYKMVQNEIDKINKYSVIISAFSMGIACIILYIIMSKIVLQEKKQIGIMKAFGYSDGKIIRHYMVSGILNAFSGTALGNLFGAVLAKTIMLPVYLERLNIPVEGMVFTGKTFIVSLIIPFVTSVLGILFGTVKIKKFLPIEAMRAGVPAVTGYMPDMSFFSKHMSKSNFIGIRNMFRSPFRTIFMILGIALCFGLTTCLFSLFGSLDVMMLSQFENHQKYDIKVMFDKNRDEADIENKINSIEGIEKYELLVEMPRKMALKNKEKNVMLTVLPKNNRLLAVYNDKEHKEERLLEGMVLSSNLASALGARSGDVLQVSDLLGEDLLRIRVSGVITQNYGIQCFMTYETYRDLYEENGQFNSALLSCREKTSVKERFLKDEEIKSFIDVEDNYRNHAAFLKAFKTMLKVFFILAVSLSSIIIFSISIISYMDRKYEFNTMQVIGYSPSEIVKTNYIECFIELFLGAAAGFPLAGLMKKTVTNVFKISEEIKMPDNVEPGAYLVGFGIILTVFIISNLAGRISIQNMNLPDALKERQ